MRGCEHRSRPLSVELEKILGVKVIPNNKPGASATLGTAAAVRAKKDGYTVVGPLLANLALAFGPPEYFSLMIVGITVLTYLSSASMLRALMMAGVGLVISTVGMDTISG